MTTGFPVSPLTPATFLVVGLARDRPGGAPAVQHPVPVRRVGADDLRRVALGVFPL